MEEQKIYLNDLKVGDILLFPAPKDSWLSQAIAVLTDSSVSHAALLYEKGETYTIAEATIGGIKYTPFPDECPFVRRREMTAEQLNNLLRAMENYITHDNDYGYADLALLGLLLLYKKFTKKTIANVAFYSFLKMISGLLLEATQKMFSKDKYRMVCSQFASQCFTDARCDLVFDKMVIDITDSNKMDSTSLMNILESHRYIPVESVSTTRAVSETVDVNVVANSFIQLIKEEKSDMLTTSATLSRSGMDESFDLDSMVNSLLPPARIIADELEKVIPQDDKLMNTMSISNDSLEASTIRNFFVTPADLLTNCCNVAKIGQIVR